MNNIAQMQPTISIIIPTYNAAAYITRAVESALSQTYAPAEILIVDHSSDNTLEIVQGLAAEHPCMQVYHIEAEGVSAARNYGITHSTGDLITYLDADDALEPTMLEELVRLLQETGADMAGCDFRDGDGSTTIYHGSEIIGQAILAEHDTRVWSKLYKRTAVQDVTFLENLTIGEDMLYLLSAALRTDLTYALVHKRLYRYTVNPKGAMERPFTPSYMDQIRCWDYAEGLLTAHDAGILAAQNAAGRAAQTDAAEGTGTAEGTTAAHPDCLLTPETYARLAAIQTVSAILVAAKIARLPRIEREHYTQEWDAARESLRRYRENRKARDYYPAGYALKVALLERYPSVFCILCAR